MTVSSASHKMFAYCSSQCYNILIMAVSYKKCNWFITNALKLNESVTSMDVHEYAKRKTKFCGCTSYHSLCEVGQTDRNFAEKNRFIWNAVLLSIRGTLTINA